MAEYTSSVAPAPSTHRDVNPWSFIPLLYFMQAIPVALVQELSSIVYKDLGIANNEIVRWTSLIAIPWSLQLLLGPLVDLNFTKRKWILGGQALVTVGLALTPFILKMEQAFPISLAVLFISAIFSALCNIATDGFILIALRKEQQSLFAGFMTTFYRLGRLASTGLLLLAVGSLMKMEPAPVSATAPGTAIQVKGKDTFELRQQTMLNVNAGLLTTDDGLAVYPEVKVPAGTRHLKVSDTGQITDGENSKVLGQIVVASGADKASQKDAFPPATGGTVTAADVQAKMSRTGAWSTMLLVLAAVYVLGFFANQFTVPKPVEDVERTGGGAETLTVVKQTLLLIGMSIGGYFAASAVVRLVLHAAAGALNVPGKRDLSGWDLLNPARWDAADPDKNIFYLGIRTGFTPVVAEVVQFAVCAAICAACVFWAKKLIKGTETGRIYSSFASQSGFFAILAFMLFYRFGEVMVARMSPLFLKDSVTAGGLAIQNDQLGFIKGVVGVLGIILGGIAGGTLISKVGLKRSFIPIALAMHIPNLLYLLAASTPLNMAMIPKFNLNLGFYNWDIGPISGTLSVIEFVDQFGYGFGYAGYMIYLMYVAQRGNYRTAHYAIGTGLGALFISLAGVISGTIQANFGYQAFFVAVILFTIPGMVTLFFIPWDDSHTVEKPVVE